MRIKLQPDGGNTEREGGTRLTEELRTRLFAEDKMAEFAVMGVPPEQASLLVKMQYRGRAMSYAAAYPDAEEMLLCLEDGEKEIAVGRLLLVRSADHWRIVDIALLNAYRGQGFGRSVLEQVQRQCAEQGVALHLRVQHGNPAARLYEWMGFYAVSQDAIGAEMVWVANREYVAEAMSQGSGLRAE
jgi:GNAT superfamily N-acetyltransferase